MNTTKSKIEYSGIIKRGQIADQLRNVALALEEGFLGIQTGKETFGVEVGEKLKFKLKAKEDGDEGEVDIEISWKGGKDREFEVTSQKQEKSTPKKTS
jgi:amphi-Trp domain-containing protein